MKNMLWIEEIVESKPAPKFLTNSKIQALYFLSMYFSVLFRLSVEINVSSLLYRKIVEMRTVEPESSFFFGNLYCTCKVPKIYDQQPQVLP